MLLGPQEREAGLVGPAGGVQPPLPVDQHEADPVDVQQAHAGVEQDLYRPIEVGRRVQLGQRLQVLLCGRRPVPPPCSSSATKRSGPDAGRRSRSTQRKLRRTPSRSRTGCTVTAMSMTPPLRRRNWTGRLATRLPSARRSRVHHRAELPAVLTGHIGRQRFADQEPLVDVEQRRRRSVGLKDPGHRVSDQVGDRGELEQRLVAFTLGLKGVAGRGQLGGLLVQLLAGDRQLLDGPVQLGQGLGQQPTSWLAVGCRAPLQLGDPVAGAAQLPGERIAAIHTASSLHLAVWTTAASRSRPVTTIGRRDPDSLDARGRPQPDGLGSGRSTAAPLRQLRKKPSTSSSNLRLWVLLTAWPTPS